ncbi:MULTISPECIES: NAD(P)-binding domain-containing protein [Mycobacterium]|uniref:6-phosphogluconate dehydrogenase NADP-binding domain-containing protein n=1 Tax=Mycobacterium paraintracellulare TaxID=1138383 RepID=A0ABM7KEF8_9MYCO|nr:MULTISPECIES: NAD(P)-binding domain-containing protein [Mycobacterium]AFC54335.1 6-phosphogluconate dehydrogenase [Mycobacterium paraintracellulare]OSC28657.1 6-phosphogluconate dehydrogenase [Mycobacterium paraintracellulare]WSE53734.1 NAD(P)-binding domain-containing protein [Mycobacterium sp. 2-64]BBY72505.1 hypothetical protein MPRI_46920 [Mycobacterium paraintracellulare]BCO89601.1 hypothetical protein MINTM015_28580 [Mycobacterium paraintracellulare]
MTEVIGFIGAGQLGEPRVSRLIDAGHPVLVHTRRREVRDRVVSHGAAVADSVADLAR